MSITRQFLLGWAVGGVYLLAVFLLIALQGLLDAAGVLSYLAGLIPFLLLHLLAVGLFVWGLLWVVRPPAYREARAKGLPAQARVLEVKRTGWRVRTRLPTHTFEQMRTHAFEHRLRVAVQPPDAPPYEAWVQVLVGRGQMPPAVGDHVSVKVHPHKRDVLAWPE
ncbi:MAG TPA: hypothetical protein VFS21_17735 [Roseiflexaceae bacterium]|nr:hypothetical protein [Roseiflexaceae bacterium]